ncbi:MAG TPA: permease [Bacteroidales bacterium]|nr:MAG: permease [Bacteroidetes bacterium GWE2_42_24]OFY25978.1 MAG: permease [Bacteroidetes bacterium GWF2_43_11]PKP25941.1 MAG: permease [Bacteroidetes bacterium HGW-Bacteroidetes-22]HBZ66612.1 permease [Bacteroidales bacterium]
MDLLTFVLLVLIGLVAGLFSGLVGLGGGIIIIPALVFLLGVNQVTAQGTSLALMLPPIGLLAAINYYRSGAINITYAIIIASAFFIGGYFGSKVAVSLPETIVRRVFAAFMILMGIKMLFGGK